MDYGYCKENSKVLNPYCKNKIPSSFSRTFFNGQKLQFEPVTLQTTYSNLYYFLPFTTERSEKINRYLGSVNFSTIDIPEATFEAKENISFDTSKLGFSCQEKEIMNDAVVKMLNKIIVMSNANLAKNADSLLSKKNVEVNVEWIGKSKKGLPQNKQKITYGFSLV